MSWFHAAALVFVLSITGFAKPKTDLLKFQVPKPTTLSKGKSATATLQFTVEKGFHVQANPASEKFLIATELKLDPSKELQVGKITYPPCPSAKGKGPCKPLKIAGSDKAINSYEGAFEIRVPVSVAAGVKPGSYSLTGKLKYQACNDQTCFFPTTLPIKIPVITK